MSHIKTYLKWFFTTKNSLLWKRFRYTKGCKYNTTFQYTLPQLPIVLVSDINTAMIQRENQHTQDTMKPMTSSSWDALLSFLCQSRPHTGHKCKKLSCGMHLSLGVQFLSWSGAFWAGRPQHGCRVLLWATRCPAPCSWRTWPPQCQLLISSPLINHCPVPWVPGKYLGRATLSPYEA